MAGKNQFSRAMIVAQIMENNLKIYRMVKSQIRLIEQHKDKVDAMVDTDEFIKGCKELLDLCGLTSDSYEDDDKNGKAGRKS
tara:strand:- start:538 stop:783 length:246 start_codon:yes stop_codon:yes gene_type:complete